MPITIPIEIGDVIRVGKFKNKRITVKEIGIDEYGLPTCNGKGIMKIRIEKLIPPKEPKTENMNHLKEDIVSNNGNGQVLNKIYKQWDSIKTQKDHDQWVKLVKSSKFGTYGTVTIFDLLDKFEAKYPNSVMKDNFETELKNALKENNMKLREGQDPATMKSEFLKQVFSKFNSSFSNEVKLTKSSNSYYLEIPIQKITSQELKLIDDFFRKFNLNRDGRPQEKSSTVGNRTNYSIIEFLPSTNESFKPNKAKLDKMITSMLKESFHPNDTQVKIKQKDKLWWICQTETDECLNAVGFPSKEAAEHSALTKGYNFSGQENMNEMEPEVLTTKKEKTKGVDKVEDMKLDKEKEIKLEILRIAKRVIKEEVSDIQSYKSIFDKMIKSGRVQGVQKNDILTIFEYPDIYALRIYSLEFKGQFLIFDKETLKYKGQVQNNKLATKPENQIRIPKSWLSNLLESFSKKKVKLTELEVTDPQIAAEMEDMAKIANEMDRLQNEMDKLKDKYKPLEQKMLQLMEEAQKTGDRAVETQKVLITIKRQGYEADSVAWKEFYKEFYPKINKRMREQADELLAAHTKVKKVASSLAVQYKGEGLVKEENIFSKLFNKAKDYINNVLNSLKNRGREIDLLLNKTKSIK